MPDNANSHLQTFRREPWNRGKLIGAKPPLQPKHVWSIRTRLEIGGRTRDLALFNLALDSKLRGCDLVALQGHINERSTLRQTHRRICVITLSVAGVPERTLSS